MKKSRGQTRETCNADDRVPALTHEADVNNTSGMKTYHIPLMSCNQTDYPSFLMQTLALSTPVVMFVN